MLALLRSRWFSTQPRTLFLECGALRDDSLELITPSPQWVDALLATARHPQTRQDAPEMAKVTRRQLTDFLAAAPDGRQPGPDAATGCPTYHFWMRDLSRPDLPLAGGIGLRIGDNDDLKFYYGHIGYHVFPPHRGQHFAERAVRLLLPLAQRHQLDPLWITCNPDNLPSRRTCQRLGATWVQTVGVPIDHPLYARGEVAKCRFRLDHAGHADR